ncbi:unnamed protein product [Meloidogyne enterolobii]|uniref:Uncharacterized protein n=1 Tax=Meloidogyne enterolobii TaxID=390850 RepID=A0ACB1ALN0_MELEN
MNLHDNNCVNSSPKFILIFIFGIFIPLIFPLLPFFYSFLFILESILSKKIFSATCLPRPKKPPQYPSNPLPLISNLLAKTLSKIQNQH